MLNFWRLLNNPRECMKCLFQKRVDSRQLCCYFNKITSLQTSSWQVSELFQKALRQHFSWSLFLLKSEFLDCRPSTLEKKRQLSKGFFLNIFFFLITSRKVSAVQFLKKGAPLRIFSPMFSKFLQQLFQSTLMKRSMTGFGSEK